jgi:DNA/RNA-binding domain of Phe-tRNA-synthetase-like protein
MSDEMLSVPEIELDPRLAPHLELGLLVADGIRVTATGEPIREAIAAAGEAHRAAFGHLAPGEVPGVVAVRRFFRVLGLDPTKIRPSSEALLRRVLKGKGLYEVNNVVDTVNLCSLRWLLPMGLYDLTAIRGKLRLTIGSPGDGYPGLGKDRVNVEGRPSLHDELGPFGAPTSDSFRSRVHDSTTRILLVVFSPRGKEERLARCLADSRATLIELCAARPERVAVSTPGNTG